MPTAWIWTATTTAKTSTVAAQPSASRDRPSSSASPPIASTNSSAVSRTSIAISPRATASSQRSGRRTASASAISSPAQISWKTTSGGWTKAISPPAISTIEATQEIGNVTGREKAGQEGERVVVAVIAKKKNIQ